MTLDAATIERIKTAIDAVGPHDPKSDGRLDLDAHARALRKEAPALSAILQGDATVRRLLSDYRMFDAKAIKYRARFERWISAISLVAVAAICLAMFLVAIPGETEWNVRLLLGAALAMVIVTFLSLFPPLKPVFDKAGGTAWRWWLIWLALVAAATFALFQYGIPDSFDAYKAVVLNTIAAIFLACAVFADFVSGGLTARLLRRRHSMFQDWQDARGRAEANRRALFMAVLNTWPPAEPDAGAAPLLSQKLEYFRRHMIGVQQSYYASKSNDNKSGTELADIARVVAFIAFALLLVGAALGWAARYSEQGSWLPLPQEATAMLITAGLNGYDDVILLVAMLTLGAYAFLQLRTVLLRQRANHRRFATALGMLQQATSMEPCNKEALSTECPLKQVREAAAGWVAEPVDGVQKSHNAKACAEVETFVRKVNQMLAVEVGDWNNMTTFSIIPVGDPPKPRLFSTDPLDAVADFPRIVEDQKDYDLKIVRARKIAFVSARKATGPERFVTRYNGKESNAVGEAGDWVVTNMDTARNVIVDADGHENKYVVKAADFDRLYKRDSGNIYKAQGIVDAIELTGGFDIVAPWRERQQGPYGYVVRNGKDVYGIHGDAFDKTYEICG